MESNKLKNYLFYFTVFINGGVILVVEILGTRIMAPFYGATIFVWSSLITTTMAALALGYFVGGKVADKKPNIDYLYLIILIGGIGLFLVPVFDKPVLVKTDVLGIRFGPLASSLLLFLPPLSFLGMVSPLSVRVKAKEVEHVGVRAGNLYALSTLGSLFGGLAAGFYLVPSFSVRFILNLLSFTLFSLFLASRILNFSTKT